MCLLLLLLLFSCWVVSDYLQPTDCSTPGFPVLHCLLQFAQTHSCPLSWRRHSTISPSVPLFLLPSVFPSIMVFSNELMINQIYPVSEVQKGPTILWFMLWGKTPDTAPQGRLHTMKPWMETRWILHADSAPILPSTPAVVSILQWIPSTSRHEIHLYQMTNFLFSFSCLLQPFIFPHLRKSFQVPETESFTFTSYVLWSNTVVQSQSGRNDL